MRKKREEKRIGEEIRGRGGITSEKVKNKIGISRGITRRTIRGQKSGEKNIERKQ